MRNLNQKSHRGDAEKTGAWAVAETYAKQRLLSLIGDMRYYATKTSVEAVNDR